MVKIYEGKKVKKMKKIIYQRYIGNTEYFIVYKNGQFIVKREHDNPHENAIEVFSGNYDSCEKFIEEKFIEYIVNLF